MSYTDYICMNYSLQIYGYSTAWYLLFPYLPKGTNILALARWQIPTYYILPRTSCCIRPFPGHQVFTYNNGNMNTMAPSVGLLCPTDKKLVLFKTFLFLRRLLVVIV